MSSLLFTIFIIAAASVDGCQTAWIACLGSLCLLYLLGKREKEGKGRKQWGIKHVHTAVQILIRMKDATAVIRLQCRNWEPVKTAGRIQINIMIITITGRKFAMSDISIKIEGLEELTKAIRILAEMTGKQPAAAITAQTVQPGPAPAVQTPPSVPMAPNYGQIPVQPAVTVGMTTQLPASNTVPVTAMPQEYTIEQLQVAAAGLSGTGKMPQLMGILQQFGIQAMTELPRERYGEFAVALREAGAQI
jgi:hypothetical protein